jgi:plastocyanin
VVAARIVIQMHRSTTRVLRAAVALTAVALPLTACGGGSSTSSGDATNADVTVIGQNIKYDKPEYQTTAGTKKIALVNKDGVEHTVTLVEEGNKEIVSANGGQTKVGTIDLKAGTYTIICTVPGHAAMKATLKVN